MMDEQVSTEHYITTPSCHAVRCERSLYLPPSPLSHRALLRTVCYCTPYALTLEHHTTSERDGPYFQAGNKQAREENRNTATYKSQQLKHSKLKIANDIPVSIASFFIRDLCFIYWLNRTWWWYRNRTLEHLYRFLSMLLDWQGRAETKELKGWRPN